jgi:hypothetical protein
MLDRAIGIPARPSLRHQALLLHLPAQARELHQLLSG